MIEKIIKYKNYNGQEKSRRCLFHLNTAEVTEWLSTDGDYGLDDRLNQILEERNGAETIDIFKDLIARSYGEKSLDGETFLKTPDITNRFICSAAYPELFNELLTDAKKAAEFFVGILPHDLSIQVDKIMKEEALKEEQLEIKEG